MLAARQDGRGATLFQHAALWGREDILEHLVEKLKPTPQRRADVYSLIGAAFVVPAAYDVHEDAQQGLAFWKKSANIQTENLTADPAEDISLGPNSAYNYAVEARDAE